MRRVLVQEMFDGANFTRGALEELRPGRDLLRLQLGVDLARADARHLAVVLAGLDDVHAVLALALEDILEWRRLSFEEDHRREEPVLMVDAADGYPRVVDRQIMRVPFRPHLLDIDRTGFEGGELPEAEGFLPGCLGFGAGRYEDNADPGSPEKIYEHRFSPWCVSLKDDLKRPFSGLYFKL